MNCGYIPVRHFIVTIDVLDEYPLIGYEKDKKDKGVLNGIGVKTPINHLTDNLVIAYNNAILFFLIMSL